MCLAHEKLSTEKSDNKADDSDSDDGGDDEEASSVPWSCLHWVTSLESPGDLWVSWLQAMMILCTFPS